MENFSPSKHIRQCLLAAVISALLLSPASSTVPLETTDTYITVDSVAIVEKKEDLLDQNYLTVRVKLLSENISQILFVCSDSGFSEVVAVNNILHIDQISTADTNEYDCKIPLEKIDALNVENGKKTMYLQFGSVELATPVQYTFTFDAFEIYNVCDINHDRVVDRSDIESLQASPYYGLPVSAESAQKLDVNQDGFINIIDIAEISLEISKNGN